MFTGLVEDIGTITRVTPRGRGKTLTIRTALPVAEIGLGDSIAVNGACLTAEELGADSFTVAAGRETLERTNVGRLGAGSAVHLERAMRMGGRLDGHLVQGHVDGVGEVSSMTRAAESWVLWIRCPGTLLRYVAPKGSIAVDGVSLTVNEVTGGAFRLNIVPHTVGATRLADYRPGQLVNLEADVIAKYVERLLQFSDGAAPAALAGYLGRPGGNR